MTADDGPDYVPLPLEPAGSKKKGRKSARESSAADKRGTKRKASEQDDAIASDNEDQQDDANSPPQVDDFDGRDMPFGQELQFDFDAPMDQSVDQTADGEHADPNILQNSDGAHANSPARSQSLHARQRRVTILKRYAKIIGT